MLKVCVAGVSLSGGTPIDHVTPPHSYLCVPRRGFLRTITRAAFYHHAITAERNRWGSFLDSADGEWRNIALCQLVDIRRHNASGSDSQLCYWSYLGRTTGEWNLSTLDHGNRQQWSGFYSSELRHLGCAGALPHGWRTAKRCRERFLFSHSQRDRRNSSLCELGSEISQPTAGS
jgi:hypothetical protein